MLGSLAGDIAGSVYEGSSDNPEGLPLFGNGCSYTDDSVVVCAVAEALNTGEDVSSALRRWVKAHPARGYGGWFLRWCQTPLAGPYNSHGNGGAVRMGPVALFARDEAELCSLASVVAGVTHSDPEALRAAQCLARCLYMAIRGASRQTIRTWAMANGMWRQESVSELRQLGEFSEMATHSVPVALVCAIEANSMEAAIRNAISVGGDTDTIAAMSGALGEALYGIEEDLQRQVEARIPPEMVGVLEHLYRNAGWSYPLKRGAGGGEAGGASAEEVPSARRRSWHERLGRLIGR